MKSRSFLITGAMVAAIAMCGPITAFAASKKASASASPAPNASPAASEKMPRSIPFHGTVSSIDKRAKTFTIQGKEKARVFKVTDKTMIKKAGLDATFSDIAADEKISGSYWKQTDGSMECRSVNVGGTGEKATSTSKKSKKEAASTDASPAPSPKK